MAPVLLPGNPFTRKASPVSYPRSKTQMIVTTDVTSWTSAQRDHLLEVIAAYEAEVGVATPASTEAKAVEPAPGSVPSSGWTVDAYAGTVAELFRGHGVQASAIMTAVQNGGVVSRDEVYELGKYPAARSLKGFTRPVSRITQRLVEKGELPEDVDDLLDPIYDPELSGYQRVQGFRVPADVVQLVHEQERQHKAASGDQN